MQIDADTNNVIATLSGNLLHQGFISKCNTNSSCNNLMIWSKYKESGYVTAFGEDAFPYHDTMLRLNKDTSLSSPIQPTDHYLRPLFKSSERKTSTMCIGKSTTGTHILNYALDFIRTYKKNRFFGIFWIKNFSQEPWQSPMTLDKKFAVFFSKLKVTGVLKNTFIILFSDHGLRNGKAKSDIGGFYEERLPMLFMHVPNSFKKNYPYQTQQLTTNQQRLISPFDLYLTIKNILKPNDVYIATDNCKTCQSLFQSVPGNRSCSDAGINDVWCTCQEIKKTSVKKDSGALISVVKAFSFIQNLRNNITLKPCTQCKAMQMKKVMRVHSFKNNETNYYIASLLLKSGVIFEVIVKRYLINGVYIYDTVWYDVIEGHNKGDCVVEYKNRKFCECTRAKKRCKAPTLYQYML